MYYLEQIVNVFQTYEYRSKYEAHFFKETLSERFTGLLVETSGALWEIVQAGVFYFHVTNMHIN